MNKKHLSSLILLVIIYTSIYSVQGQNLYLGITHDFNMGPNYDFSTFAQAPLIWDENSNQTLFLNITINSLPDNISSIEINAITYVIYGTDTDEDGVYLAFSSDTPQQSLNTIGEEIQLEQTFIPTALADTFFINITILARTKGNVTEGENNPYSFRFPQQDTIFIDRENNLVPLINLYGFPPSSFFAKWIPIYLSAIFIMAIPSLIAGVSILRDRRKLKNIGGIENE